MAAAIKALNARIRANPYLDYFCSTHFWGPASNFGIPLAAIADISKDPEIISGRMTGALALYSAVFMRYSLAVTPKNYLLFGCHITNFASQLTQGYRYVNYWHMGGRDSSLGKEGEKAKEAGKDVKVQAEQVMNEAKGKAEEIGGKVKEQVQSVTGGKK